MMTQPEPAPSRSDARANRERVLQAARQVVGARGESAEVREIADRAGVGLATIYRGFGNKEGLLAALAREAQKDLEEIFASAEQKSNAAEQLRALLAGAVDYINANAPLFDILASRLQGHANDRFPDLHSKLGEIVERGVAGGEFRADLDVRVLQLLLVGSLISMAHSRALLPQVSGGEFADRVLGILAQDPR